MPSDRVPARGPDAPLRGAVLVRTPPPAAELLEPAAELLDACLGVEPAPREAEQDGATS